MLGALAAPYLGMDIHKAVLAIWRPHLLEERARLYFWSTVALYVHFCAGLLDLTSKHYLLLEPKLAG